MIVLGVRVKMVPPVQMPSMNFPVNVWRDMKEKHVNQVSMNAIKYSILIDFVFFMYVYFIHLHVLV